MLGGSCQTARTSSGEWSLVSKTQTKEESEQPSAEAASRLLIGTVMLSKAAPAPALDTVKRERDRVLGEVNR